MGFFSMVRVQSVSSSSQIGLAGASPLDVSGRVFLALCRVFRVRSDFRLKIMACAWHMNYCHTLI
jgi:hypothetical protein